MENKVILYDSNENKIGETFLRRAKQLVKQQRALWVGDDQTAIKFKEGMEDLDKDEEKDEPVKTLYDEEKIIALAEKRIRERRLFWAHTIALIPGFFVCMLFASMFYYDAAFIGGLLWGSWGTAYLIHFYFYSKNKSKKRSKRSRALIAEIANIKEELDL